MSTTTITTIRPGLHVRTALHGDGVVVRHHPQIAAWIVRTRGCELAYTDDQIWTVDE